MKIKMNSNLATGILFAIVSAIMLALIPSQIPTMETTRVTARTVPTLMMGLILVLSVFLIVQGLRMPKQTVVINKELLKNKRFRSEMKSLLFIAMLLIYALIFDKVGFLISSLALSAGVLAYYKCKKWWYYAIAFANVGIVYVVFKILLRVNLP